MKGVTTKREKEALAELMSILKKFQWDMAWRISAQGRLPSEWTTIWRERSRGKSRVTIRVDDDVLRFFRAMGDGFGPRMNGVLRAFMLAQLSGLIEHEDLPEQWRERWMGKARPRLGSALADAWASQGFDPDKET